MAIPGVTINIRDGGLGRVGAASPTTGIGFILGFTNLGEEAVFADALSTELTITGDVTGITGKEVVVDLEPFYVNSLTAFNDAMDDRKKYFGIVNSDNDFDYSVLNTVTSPNIGDPLEIFCNKEFEVTKQPVVDFFNTLGDGHNVYVALAPEKNLTVGTYGKVKETYVDLFSSDGLASKLIRLGRARILSLVVSFDERDAGSGKIDVATTSGDGLPRAFKGGIGEGVGIISTFLNLESILNKGFSCIAYVAGNNIEATADLDGTTIGLNDIEPTTAIASRVLLYIGAQYSRLVDSDGSLLTDTGTGFEEIGLHADIGVYVARTLARRIAESVGQANAPFSLAAQALTNGDLVDSEPVLRAQEKLSNYFNFPIIHSLLDGYYFTSALLLAGSGSDFSRVPEVRLLDYVIRAMHLATLAYVNVPIPIEGNKISFTWLNTIKAEISGAIAVAVDGGASGQQVSRYEIIIPDNQNVISTDQLVIDLAIFPNGRASQVINNIYFQNALANSQ